MSKHSARTTQQLLDAAMQGEQHRHSPVSLHAHHYHRQELCPTCERYLDQMKDAKILAEREASERAALYASDDETITQEYDNAMEAYYQAETQPARTYLLRYAEQTARHARTARWKASAA